MSLKIFTVYDLKACVYLRPVFAVNAGAALRDFGGEVSGNEKSMLFAHPEDFQLFEIGEFNDETGEIKGLVPVKFLASGVDFAPAKPFVKGEYKPDRFVRAMVASENGSDR